LASPIRIRNSSHVVIKTKDGISGDFDLLDQKAKALALRVPTLEDAVNMPSFMCELSNEALIILAENGNHEACTERLVRDVMRVDKIEWAAARDVVKKIRAESRKGLWLATLPYKIGMTCGLVTGFGCLPMIFHKPTAMWFNQIFVTTAVPDKEDLETMLEVGSWTWGWMEPALGTASFTLLALQYVRAQMVNMDYKPYTNTVKFWRAERLHKAFPQYNEDMVFDFATTASLKTKH